MKSNPIALATALLLALATPAFAASAPALTAGGHTLAGPGSVNLALNATQTVYTDASANADTCVTVVNSGKATVRLSITNDVPNTTSIDVLAGASGALCRDSTEQVDLLCVGPSSCTAQWRLDRD